MNIVGGIYNLNKIRRNNGEKDKPDTTSDVSVPETDTSVKHGDIISVSSSFLANVTYCPTKYDKKTLKRALSDIKDLKIPDDFYDKFDYENAGQHIENIKLLKSQDSDFGYGKAFKNGYFYSKEGLDALQILKENYAVKSLNVHYRAPIDLMLEIPAEDILKAKDRGIFPLSEKIKSCNDKFNAIKDYVKLTAEEYERVKELGFDVIGINYASKNKDINSMFKTIVKKPTGINRWTAATLKRLESKIIEYANGDEQKIKEFSERISNVENIEILYELCCDDDENNIDLSFVADNIDTIHSLLNEKIDDFKDNGFFVSFKNFIKKLNPDNIDVFKEILDIKGMDTNRLFGILNYMYTKENVKVIKDIADKINKDEESIIAFPSCKYAKINERVANSRNNELKEYDANTSLEEISSNSMQGDVFAHGDDIYAKDNGNLVKIDIDKKMYKKLFPEYKTLCIQQGKGTGDCYFLTGGLISFWKNKNAKINLLKLLKQEGNDIVITIPAFKKYPVRFKDCKLKEGSLHADTSLGNLMLEQAYAKSKYASLNKIKGDASNINIDKAMKFIYGGYESNVFNELTGSNNAIEYVNKSYKNAEHDLRHPKYISNEKMSELLDQYADSDKYILCAGSGVRESGSLPDYGVSSNHAYAIEKIDKENKTVTIINPYNSLFVSEISYEQFMKFFASLSVMKVG